MWGHVMCAEDGSRCTKHNTCKPADHSILIPGSQFSVYTKQTDTFVWNSCSESLCNICTLWFTKMHKFIYDNNCTKSEVTGVSFAITIR